MVRKNRKPDITNLSLPRLSPSAMSHTSSRRPISSHLVSKGPPGLPPGHLQEFTPETPKDLYSLLLILQ